MFGTLLKTGYVSMLAAAIMTSPAVSKVRRTQVFDALDRRRTRRDEDVYSSLGQLGRELRQPVELSFGPAVLDGDVCSLRVAELPESIPYCVGIA
jgi:hypothetical protein